MSVIEQDSTPSEEEQLVAVRLGNETYGVDISKIHGIITMQPITRIPRTPDFVNGVINLRGRVVPVVDLRKRFGLEVTGATRETRIVIVETGDQTIGMVVDGVSEVLTIPADAIDPPSPVATGAGTEYIRGIGKIEDRLIILLDIGKVLARDEFAELKHTGGSRTEQAGDNSSMETAA
jgi:purine-binding chemotaxis protein CheW